MPATPEEPQGLGTPSGSHPGFAPPPGAPNWAAPDPGPVVPPPPSGRRHRTNARTRVRLVAAMLAAALVLIGILSALPLLPISAPQPQPEPAAPPVPIVTTTPSIEPGTASTARHGGDLGATVSFRSGRAAGSVTVSTAVWTDAGEMAPESGRRYLVLTVTIRCTEGTMPVDALMFVAQDPDGPVLPGFGPLLTNPLGGKVLGAGESVQGQVGFSVVAGEVSLRLLDPDLQPTAAVRIPAP